MASTWDTVVTPVPPIPASRTVNASGSTSAGGVANASGPRVSIAGAERADPGSTVRNAGQSPSRQE